MRASVMCVAALCVAVLCAGVGAAQGQIVLFNTFGAGDAFSTASPLVVGRQSTTTNVFAAKFTTTSNGTINGVQVALGPTTPAGLQVTLQARIFGHSLATGLPTTANDTMTPQTVTLGAAQLVTFQSTAFLETFSGTTGWVVISLQEPVSSGQTVLWNKSPSATGQVALSTNGGAFALQGGGGNVAMPAMRVLGESLNGACCNTATGQCIMTGHLECTRWTGFTYFPGSGCTPQRCPAPCGADFNASGLVTVQDVYDFLAAWLAGCP